MGWIYLLLGGVFEIGWPLGMKLAQATGHRFLFLSVSVISMALSGYFLLYGTKDYSDRDGLCRMDGNWSHRHIVDRHFLFP